MVSEIPFRLAQLVSTLCGNASRGATGRYRSTFAAGLNQTSAQRRRNFLRDQEEAVREWHVRRVEAQAVNLADPWSQWQDWAPAAQAADTNDDPNEPQAEPVG